jgi:cell shape-determining protein MreD
MRYLLLGLVLALALAIEGLAGSLPFIGFLAPDFALLFVLVYAMKGSGRDLLSLCFVAGVMKGSVSPESAGFYILLYLAAAAIVLRTRELLFIEFATTQVVLLFLAGCLALASHLALSSAGLIPGLGAGGVISRLLSSAVTAFLAPLAVEVYDRSRFIRTHLAP